LTASPVRSASRNVRDTPVLENTARPLA
jgi:hypothetical protein